MQPGTSVPGKAQTSITHPSAQPPQAVNLQPSRGKSPPKENRLGWATRPHSKV